MLYAHKVTAALEAKRAGFGSGEDSFAAALAAYRGALSDLAATFPTSTLLAERLGRAQMGSGARPTARYDAWVAQASTGDLPLLPLGRGFAHHAEAREWAEVAIR
ncbi:MAG: hypothetical protein H0X24_06070, partial [Ktedonobacterales bacterium]|nr:hypothetical protein [Ktedonobacterales bacterium]